MVGSVDPGSRVSWINAAISNHQSRDCHRLHIFPPRSWAPFYRGLLWKLSLRFYKIELQEKNWKVDYFILLLKKGVKKKVKTLNLHFHSLLCKPYKNRPNQFCCTPPPPPPMKIDPHTGNKQHQAGMGFFRGWLSGYRKLADRSSSTAPYTFLVPALKAPDVSTAESDSNQRAKELVYLQ